MTPAARWRPGWLTIAIAGAAGFLLGVVVLVLARGIVHDAPRTVTRTVAIQAAGPLVPDVRRRPLDEASSILAAAGYDGKVVHGGGLFGVLDPSAWVVVGQDPRAGAREPRGATVRLSIDRA